MASTNYKRLDDNEQPPQYEYRTEAETPLFNPAQRPATVELGYTRELNRCCVCISFLNFMICSWCGVPALIFTILGLEAERKRERGDARIHSRYMILFNKLGCIVFLTLVVLFSTIWLIRYLVYEHNYHENIPYTYEPVPSTYTYSYYNRGVIHRSIG